MYEGFNTIGIIFLLFFYFLQIPISKSKVYLFFFEKVIGKIGISYFTYRKMQPRLVVVMEYFHQIIFKTPWTIFLLKIGGSTNITSKAVPLGNILSDK
jgi:hypothetical protein